MGRAVKPRFGFTVYEAEATAALLDEVDDLDTMLGRLASFCGTDDSAFVNVRTRPRTDVPACPFCRGVLQHVETDGMPIGRIVEVLRAEARALVDPLPADRAIVACGPCDIWFSLPKGGAVFPHVNEAKEDEP